MQIINGKSGWIEIICGPMFSGKSEELIKRLRRAQIAKRRVQIFKHGSDARYDATSIVSHSQMSLPGVAISDINELMELVDDRTELVAIDEGQFFSDDILAVTNKLANQGKRIIVAGLDMDYLGNPFGPMPKLMCSAEYVSKQLAICMSCGDPANFTQRLTQATEQVVVGADETYEARCRLHFEPAFESSLQQAKKKTKNKANG
ncbi:MAG: thymidine kinase [bacterium]|nr:thymidine kinase [bacterium]